MKAFSRYAFAASLSLTLASCAAKKSSADSDLAGAKPQWEKMIQCENGSVTVDFDRNDRTRMQMVLTRSSIFSVIDRDYGYGQIKNANERIYRGQAGAQGIYKPSDFTNFYTIEESTIDDGTRPGFEVTRSGSNLLFRELDLNHNHCGSSIRRNNFDACSVRTYTFYNCN